MTVVVDASAFLAILLREPEGELFQARILESTAVWMSPVNYWESMVRARALFGNAGVADAEALFEALGIRLAAVGEAQAREAVAVAGRFGGGTPARLNLGDCFAYALAKAVGAPLLYKGDDFARTDLGE